MSIGEKKPLPVSPYQGLSLGNDLAAHGLGLNHAPLAHIRVLCPDQDMEMFQSWGGLRLYTGSLTTCPALTRLLLTSVPMNALMGEREAWISAFVVEPHANW